MSGIVRTASASCAVIAVCSDASRACSSRTARSAAAAASAAATFSKPVARSSTRSSPGKGVAPPRATSGRAGPRRRRVRPTCAPRLRRTPSPRAAAGDRPTRTRRRRPAHPSRTRPPPPAGTRPPRGSPTGRRPPPAPPRPVRRPWRRGRHARPDRRQRSRTGLPGPRARHPRAAPRSAPTADASSRSPWRARPASRPEHAEVTGVGAAGGEGDLVGTHPEAVGDHRPGVVEHQPGVAGRAVQAPRVGVPALESLQQHLARGGVQRGTGRVIEVRRNGGVRNASRRARSTVAHRAKPTGALRGDRGVVSSRVSLTQEGFAVQKKTSSAYERAHL